MIVRRFLLLNLFVAALTDGLSRADDDMVEFDDEDETPTVREPNFFAPGQLLHSYFPASFPSNVRGLQISSSLF